MPKLVGTKNTHPDLRSLIYNHAQSGTSLPEIANLYGVHLRTVQRILKNYQERGYHIDAPRSGRPPRLDQRAIRHLNHHVERNRRQPLADITQHVNTFTIPPVASRTVKRALNKALGLNAHVAAKKPFLKKVHRQARHRWARGHRGWGEKDWHHVIWTDESSVEIGKDSRVPWVWRRPGERYDEGCLAPTFKSGRQSLMIWGCIAYGRLGPLIRIPKEERSGADYVRLVLADTLWDFYSELYEERGLVAVMEDGAPVHRCKLASNFRTSHFMEVFPHPAQSPDLNPIEHLWKILKTRINARENIPKNADEMWSAIQEEWKKIDVEMVNTLVTSMPARVEAVLKVKGGSTKY
jgi:transposase